MTFGEKLREFRDARHLGLRELARAAHMDFTLLSKIETGQRPPPDFAQILVLADALRLRPDELEGLLALATEPNEASRGRLTQEDLERLRSSKSLHAFLRLKNKSGQGGDQDT